MNEIGLTEQELGLIRGVLRRHRGITGVLLYGSRAKGVSEPSSDVDLALVGVDRLEAGRVAAELDELPLPYRFDIKAYDAIEYLPLRQHIERVGIRIA
jgi:predicted nucleotidyltransferase